MDDRSWVKANTIPIGTTTISFRCRKPKTTVVIIMKHIVRVTIPIHITKAHELRKSMEYKRKTEQNVRVMTRQYPITKVLRWSVTRASMTSCWTPMSSEGSFRMSVVILKPLKEFLSGGQMWCEEEAYTIREDDESRARLTDLFVDTSWAKANIPAQ